MNSVLVLVASTLDILPACVRQASLCAAWLNAINTAGGANSRITNNVHTGTISSAGTDTLTANVAY